MTRSTLNFLKALIATAAVVCTAAEALGLQVSPINIDLTPEKSVEGLWLSNSGSEFLQAQVRVYHWDQQGGKDVLTPTQNLVVSPPVSKVKSKDRQLVRVIKPAKKSGASGEEAFRVVVNELPVSSDGKEGVKFLMEYSIPVFFSTVPAEEAKPNLKFSFVRGGQGIVLRVANSGNTHAKLSALVFVAPNGQRTEVASGLAGYVLPSREFDINIGKASALFVKGGTMEMFLNGKTHTETIAPFNQI